MQVPAPINPEFQTAPSDWTVITIDKFIAGLYSSLGDSSIKDQYLSEMTNWLINYDGTMYVRGGYTADAFASISAVLGAAPISFHRYTRGTVDTWLAAIATGVYYWNTAATPDAWQAIQGFQSATGYTITDADATGETFKVSGNRTTTFTNGVAVRVSGNTAGNNGDYTVNGNSTYDGGTGKTTITVTPGFAGTDGGGSIYARTDIALTTGYQIELLPYSSAGYTDLLIFTGYESPIRFIGTASSGLTTSDNLGLTPPVKGSPGYTENADSATTRGVMYNGVYTYKVTAFYSSTNTRYGESGPCETFSATTTSIADGNRATISFTSMPAVPTGATKNYVYRSPCGSAEGPFRLVGEYTGTTFTDTCPDDEEGIDCPIDAGTPPKLKYVVNANGRLFGANGDIPTKLVWSNLGQPDYFGALSYGYFNKSITGVALFRNNLYVFTEDSMYVLEGCNVEGQFVKVCDIGCSSHRSLVDCGLCLTWLYNGIVYAANFNDMTPDGKWAIPVGEPVMNVTKEIPAAMTTKVVGAVINENMYLSFASPSASSNNLTYCLNIPVCMSMMKQGLYGGWSKVDWKASDIKLIGGALYHSDYDTKYIYKHIPLSVTDTLTYGGSPVNISSSFATKRTRFGSEWSNKIMRSISVESSTPSCTLTCDIGVNNDEYVRTTSLVLASGNSGYTTSSLFWDTGLWAGDSDTDPDWAFDTYTASVVHKKLASGLKGRDFKLRFSTTNSNRITLEALRIYIKQLPLPA